MQQARFDVFFFLGKEERNLLYVVVELLRHLPAGVALLALGNVVGQQVGINEAGNATSEKVLLHLWTTTINTTFTDNYL